MLVRFDHPVWLLGLLLLVPMAWVMIRWCGSMSLLRRCTAVAVRAALLAILMAMLAGVSSVRTTDKLALLAVVDVSGSVRGFAPPTTDAEGHPVAPLQAARRWLAQAVGKRGPEDLVGLVAFDGQAALVWPPTSADGPLDHPLDLRLADGTDIASAIRLAIAALPPDAAGRILLISDGVSTQGDPLAAAAEATTPAGGAGGSRAARLDQIPIDVLPIRYDVRDEVIVESVDAPARAPAGAAIAVRVALSSTGPASGTLRLFYEDRELPTSIDGSPPALGQAITLEAGRRLVILSVPLGPARVHRFRVLFEPELAGGSPRGDTIASNNLGEAVTVTPGRGSVLVLDGVAGGAPDGAGAVLAQTLREEGIKVDLAPADQLPADLLRLEAYDLVILQNVAADLLGEAGQERLVRYVTELGGGLVMIGGPDSFAAGGYRGGRLEPILPVRLDLPDRLIVPATAVVIVLDVSGSMGFRVMGSSRTQQDIANEGAAIAVRSLDATDLVGVIAFSSDAEVIVPLARNSDPLATAGKILALEPDGGTNLPPALAEAHRQLKGADAKVKHVIVLTDGVSRGRTGLRDAAKRLADDGIKLSTIAVGDGADTDVLASMATANGGQYYRVVDPTVLPRVFLRAVRVVRTPMIRETPFVPVVVDPASPLLEGVPSADTPALLGLTLTQPRPESTALYPLVTADGEPVLAHWQAGLGQVAAFTSDAHGHWAAQWLSWPGYRALWTRIARQIARPGDQRAAELAAEVVGDELRLRMDAFAEDGRPLDALVAPAAIYSPDGVRTDAQLSQTAPGVYEYRGRVEQSGSYVVTIAPRQGSRALAPVVGGVTKPAGAEFRVLRSNPRVLEDIAATTGGRVLDFAAPQQARFFDRSQTRPREARTPLWPLLMPWAIMLALADVAVRRLAWDRLLTTRFGEGLRRHAARMLQDRGARAETTIGQLREVEAEVEAREADYAGARLTTADARRIVQERRRQRAAAQSATGGQRQPPPAPPSRPPEPAPADQGGLAAAKRRAKERFDADG